MKTEYSYGIIPFKKKKGEWNVLLIQHAKALHWGFPKGHAEKDEQPQEAAFRELLEETDLQVVHLFSEQGFEQHYHYHNHGVLIKKTVVLFAAEVEGTVKLQKEEVSDSVWCTFDQAIKTLTYPADQEVFQKVIALNQSSIFSKS